MLSKNYRWIVVSIAAFVTLVFWGMASPMDAHAAGQVTVTTDNSCLSCHENLYYLHDTGCWYCMTDAHKDRCVDCHEGNPSAVKEEVAHIGLLAHPQENKGTKCLECHPPEEAQILMAKFESNQGFDTVIHAEPYIPSEPVVTGFPDVAEPNPIRENLGFLVFAFLMFGVWLALALKSSS